MSLLVKIRVFLARSKRRNRADEGVTLVEMIIVLAIIAMVAALIVPNVIGRPDEARKTVAVSDMKTVAAALKMYRLDNGDYPTTEQGLAALSTKPTSGPEAANWQQGGYLERAPKDPWGRQYIYKSPGREAAFELLSYGKDGKPGGDGLNADLVEGAN